VHFPFSCFRPSFVLYLVPLLNLRSRLPALHGQLRPMRSWGDDRLRLSEQISAFCVSTSDTSTQRRPQEEGRPHSEVHLPSQISRVGLSRLRGPRTPAETISVHGRSSSGTSLGGSTPPSQSDSSGDFRDEVRFSSQDRGIGRPHDGQLRPEEREMEESTHSSARQQLRAASSCKSTIPKGPHYITCVESGRMGFNRIQKYAGYPTLVRLRSTPSSAVSIFWIVAVQLISRKSFDRSSTFPFDRTMFARPS
jgi:hypothetical protein